MFQFVLLVLIVSVESSNRTCTKVNGISGACGLTLDQITLAGTHNSGSGAAGEMKFWASDVVAMSCWWRNQDRSITEQLELGIRYFDFDVSYINEEEGFAQAGIVLVHRESYGMLLQNALLEIRTFMKSHLDEVIVIRMKDVNSDREQSLKDHIVEEFSEFEGIMNSDSKPVLCDAIRDNRRLLLFVNGGIYNDNKYHHQLKQIETYVGGDVGTDSCFTVDYIVNKLAQDWRFANDKDYTVQVDWYKHSQGHCVKDLAKLCAGKELNKLRKINQKLLRSNGRGVNLVLIDYIQNVKLRDVVKRMNRDNVRNYTVA